MSDVEPRGRPTRVSDADRDAAIDRLKDRVADGTLTLDEFADRVDRALTASVTTDLHALTADLGTTAGDVGRVRRRHRLVAVMAAAETKGRWRCGDRVTAIAVMGGCHLDFRRAEIAAPEVHVLAVAVMGGVDIVVPEGIEVVMDGLPIMGGRSMQIKDVPVLPGSPRIVVHAYPVMGGVVVRSRPRHQAKAVADERPISLPQPAPPALAEGTVTIMFIDVCDYTGMTERLGDARAHDLLREHNVIVRAHLQAYGGREVKSNGDGFMVTFGSAARAVRCAVAVQQSLADRNAASTEEPIRVHVGIHAGDVVHDGDDYAGGAVIIASRLADVARPDEILVSGVARELAGGSREFAFDDPRPVQLKGISEARQAYSVRWRAADAPSAPAVILPD